jgi:hypothetical protein
VFCAEKQKDPGMSRGFAQLPSDAVHFFPIMSFRFAKIETVMRYDDARRDDAGHLAAGARQR